MNSTKLISTIGFVTLSFFVVCANAQTPKPKTAAAAKPITQLPAKTQAKVQPAGLRVPASASPTAGGLPVKLPNVDPNSAVEIRGQARSLSMMLVLKNGKDSINFIKPRKDYKPEISTTEY